MAAYFAIVSYQGICMPQYNFHAGAKMKLGMLILFQMSRICDYISNDKSALAAVNYMGDISREWCC
jgi:hypothetical protein